MPRTIQNLECIANQLRLDLIPMLRDAGSGHTAGPLGMADIFTALYFGGILKINPKKSNDPTRDRLFLCNGHICPIWYVALAHAGFFPKKELSTLRKINSRLQGHPHLGTLPGIENTGGPLGQGISQAVGAAYAFKLDGTKQQVFCLMSDGELNEGQPWEAFLFAAKHKLDNLTCVIDRNNIQIDGTTEDVMPLEPLADKIKAFNFHVIEIDGNNMQAIMDAFGQAYAITEKPVMIIAHTVPGKGVSFMEHDYKWHGITPKSEEAERAIAELLARKKELQCAER